MVGWRINFGGRERERGRGRERERERKRESWRRILTEERLKDTWNVRFKDVGYMA